MEIGRLGKNGNVVCILVGGFLMLPSMALVGLTTQLWEVALANCLVGCCLGLYLGGLMNLPNSYITRVFPHKIAADC